MAQFRHKIYVDCNVILDWACRRHPFDEDASKVIAGIENNQFDACVSGLVLANVYYILSKHVNKKIADGFLDEFRQLFTILNLTESCVVNAIQNRYKDFEDDLHYFCAKEHAVTAIITRNTKDFPKNISVNIFTPAEFLQLDV